MKDKTTKMLQKCSLGAKMGVSGINAAQRYVGDPKLLFFTFGIQGKASRDRRRGGRAFA